MNYINKEILASNLDLLMRHYGYSQTSLGKKMGVSQKTVCNYLKPELSGSPTLEKMEDIARAFNIDVWKLLIKDASLDFLLSKKSYMQVIDGDKGVMPPRLRNAISFLSSPPEGQMAISGNVIKLINSLVDGSNAKNTSPNIKHDNQAGNHK